jgi:hypothetical protein
MASEVSVTRRDAYLFIHVQGDPVTPEERRSIVARTLGEAAELNLDIVVHEDTHGLQPLTAVEYFARANFLGTSDFKKRIAYVPPEGMPPDIRGLISNAARSEGREVRLFSHVEDAIKWIECRQDDTGRP